LAPGLLARGIATVRTDLVQVRLHRGVAIAAISGNRGRSTAHSLSDACDRRRQLRRVYRVSDLNTVVKDHAVDVIDDLGLVTELHRLAESAFADRPGIDVIQTDHSGRRIGHHAGQTRTPVTPRRAVSLFVIQSAFTTNLLTTR
jgi:hypothetical protein